MIRVRSLLAAAALIALVGCSTQEPVAPEFPVTAEAAGRYRSIPTGTRQPAVYAVIGDAPYGSAALGSFPSLIADINADDDVSRAIHLGDTKNGSTVCSDDWFHTIYDEFETFEDPLVYTPGDNEWTDCHRDNNGNYNPRERLRTLRDIYFGKPGRTLGANPAAVEAQRRYPENQMWIDAGVVFAAIHIVGSNNGMEAATCSVPFSARCPDGDSPETRYLAGRRRMEAKARDAANRRWLDRAFALADRHDAAGVVIFAHGDMWHPSDRQDPTVSFSGHQKFVERLARRAARFGDPVLLFAGDSHNYRVDKPLIGDTNYGAPDAPNLTQITVDRAIEDDIVWLRLTIDPSTPDVFSWAEVVVH